jgi:molybdopterin synthase catalytic subunit
MQCRLTEDPIDYVKEVEYARGPSSGAVVLFLGTVRDLSEGRSVTGLNYETYPPMALSKLNEIVVEARSRWPLHHANVVHRHGRLELGEIAVSVTTASAHRAEAFAAAEWIMDTIKEVAPIWKRENWADGAADWVHPADHPEAS